MALTHYLGQIDKAQLAFSVKQQKPTTLDSAVSTTLEMESYLPQKGGSIWVAATDRDVQMATIHNDSTPGIMKELLDRIKKLETELHEIRQPTVQGRDKQRTARANQGRRSNTNVVCWRCNRPGHFARDCYTQLLQGNEYPRMN